jgi:hypothetical protein
MMRLWLRQGVRMTKHKRGEIADSLQLKIIHGHWSLLVDVLGRFAGMPIALNSIQSIGVTVLSKCSEKCQEKV